jgi:DNA-binding transcriptional ArsR family regulator
VLAGGTRLALLRAVIDSPDQTVTGLANRLELSLPRTSQELRRLQARGLIHAHRRSQHVLYRPVPDPLVSTAAPLLQAMRDTFAQGAPSEDNHAIRVATGFSHVRRLVLVRLLQQEPMPARTLEIRAGMSRDAINRHVHLLQDAGVVRRIGRKIELAAPAHPLAKCLLGILADSPVPGA